MSSGKSGSGIWMVIVAPLSGVCGSKRFCVASVLASKMRRLGAISYLFVSDRVEGNLSGPDEGQRIKDEVIGGRYPN
jgi:hypothetical protein